MKKKSEKETTGFPVNATQAGTLDCYFRIPNAKLDRPTGS